MKNRFSVVEKDGRYHLYEGGKEYLTPCLFPLSSRDKGLMEAIARRLGENKPNVVMLYLRKYDNPALVEIIHDLAQADVFSSPGHDISMNKELCAASFKNIQLRKLIDAYVECGSMHLITDIFITDLDEEYDDFLYGMAVTSGVYSSSYEDQVDTYIELIYDSATDQDYQMDMDDDKYSEYLTSLIVKYNAVLVPKAQRARDNFIDLLCNLCNPKDQKSQEN